MIENRHINIPVFIPHKGCPHTCIFCDQRTISGSKILQTPQKVNEMLKDSISTTQECGDVEIAFFGGSFTGIPENEMIEYLEVAKPYIDTKKVNGIRLSTRPDYINSRIMDILVKYGVTAIELGVQSLDNDVLVKSERGHTIEDTIKACQLIKQRGISLGIQTMIGLPADNLSKALKTAYGVVSLKPEAVRIYPACVIKNTQMANLYSMSKYTPLTIDEAVNWCAQIVPIYRDAKIKILRIGLHSSEILKDSIIAGPYHPAFGELVESSIILKCIEKQLIKLNLPKGDKIVIRSRPQLLSIVIGQNKSNIKTIKEKYGFKQVKVIPDPEVREIEIQRQDDLRRNL